MSTPTPYSTSEIMGPTTNRPHVAPVSSAKRRGKLLSISTTAGLPPWTLYPRTRLDQSPRRSRRQRIPSASRRRLHRISIRSLHEIQEWEASAILLLRSSFLFCSGARLSACTPTMPKSRTRPASRTVSA